MATTAISVSEYLATMWRPDREYVDGEVRERNLGEKEHGLLQTFLAAWFFNHRREWRIVPITELRVQTLPENFRVPDVVLVKEDQQFDRYLTQPALLCIEIMSPEDRLPSQRERIDEYIRMGVPEVWLIDPQSRWVYVASAGKFEQFSGQTLRIAGTEIYLPLAEMWAELQ